MLPQTITNFNLILDGVGMAGLVEEFNPPVITRKLEEYRNGGMFGTADLDLGLERLECEFTLTGYPVDVIKHLAVQTVDGVPFRLLAAETPSANGVANDAIEIAGRGFWKELDPGTIKSGEKNTLKVTMPLTYYKITKNSVGLVEIDTVNMIFKVDGEDLLADQRSALSLS